MVHYGVESGHLQSPPPRRNECGNRTHYFSNSPRVTIRVNCGTTCGYVRTQDRRHIDVRGPGLQPFTRRSPMVPDEGRLAPNSYQMYGMRRWRTRLAYSL